MKRDREFIDALENEAKEQLSSIRSYRTYKGTQIEYLQRAKVAIAIIGSYVRLRGTMANEETNRLIAMRMALEGRPEAPPVAQLPPARS